MMFGYKSSTLSQDSFETFWNSIYKKYFKFECGIVEPYPSFNEKLKGQKIVFPILF